MRTSLTAMTALTALIALLIGNGAQAQALSYLGQQHVATGTQFAGTTVGGLSGIDFDAMTGRFVAISDDRSAANPARFYSLNLDLAQFQRSATPGSAGVAFQSVTTILNSDGNPSRSMRSTPRPSAGWPMAAWPGATRASAAPPASRRRRSG